MKIFKRPKEEAFKNALDTKFFNEEGSDDNEVNPMHVGNWMYMHSESDGRDAFKDIMTRRYVACPNTVEGLKEVIFESNKPKN